MSISSLLIVLSACASIVSAKVVAEPEITARAVLPRQAADQRIIGYYSTIGEITWDSAACESFSTWTVSSNYGRCCSSGSSCDFATRCSNDYAMVAGTSVSCTYTCNTDYIYTSTGGLYSTKWIGCAAGFRSTSFYVTPPATALFNTFGGSSTDTDTTTSRTVRPTVTVAPIVPTATPTSITRRKKKSMIWIVGVVVGVVVLFAIIGAIAFILISKKKKKARAAALAAGQNTYGGAPPANFQQPMQQQYGQPPMNQPQYGHPPPEGGYYTADPKTAAYSQNPISPPPPVWTPSQQHSPSQPPVSPQTRHASLAPSEIDHQREVGNKSPGGTVSEIGTNSINNLGSNPNLPPQSPTGTHLTGISEMNTPQQAKVPMQAHNNQGPVSELQ